MATKFDVDDISCSFNGTEVTGLKSFKPENYQKETTFISGIHGPTGHQHKYREPKATLKVSPDSNIIEQADELAESKDTFPIVFQTPFKVYNCIDCVIDSIDDGEQNEEAQDVTITCIPLKIEVQKVR